MLAEVASKTFRDRLTMSLVAGASVAVLTIVGAFAYDAMGIDTATFTDAFPEALQSLMGLGVGSINYVIGEMFALFTPIVVLVVGISAGAAAIAGEERDGTAAALFAQPVTRRGVLAAKAAVLIAHVVLTAAIIFLGAALAGVFSDLGVSVADLAATALLAAALGTALGMVALALSAATGSVTTAIGATSALAVSAYLAKSIFPLIRGWERLAELSPWYYYDGSEPLANGLDPLHLGVSVALAAAGFGVAMLTVDRRDLGSGGTRRSLTLPAGLSRFTDPPVGGLWSLSIWHRIPTIAITGGALAAAAVAFGAMFPSIESLLADMSASLPDQMAAFIGSADMATGAGWISAELLSIVAPGALIGVCATVAVGSVAGEIRRSRLQLLLALPVRRSSFMAVNAATVAVVAVAISLLTGLGMMAGSAIGGLGLTAVNVTAAMVHLAAFGAAFGMIALALGSALSSRAAIGTTVALAAVAYFSQALLMLSANLAGWAAVSPWYHYSANDPLSNGLSVGHVAVLLCVGAGAAAISVVLFERRDVNA